MAERKASNRYYPPEFWDQKGFSDKSNLNSYRGEGWRNRGAQVNSKLLTQGRDVIRFEMPFDIWCGKCEQVIHKGVRFNADKHKAGKYLSTTIWEFEMKCHLCDNKFSIRTDPQNTTYLCVAGCRAKNNDWDQDADTAKLPDAKEQRRLAEDPFYRLEHSAAPDGSGRRADEMRAREARPALYHLKDVQDVRSRDDGTLNRLLRKGFRVEKKEALRKEKEEAEERERLNLGIPLLPAAPEDVAAAQAQMFQRGGLDEERRYKDAKAIQRRAILLAPILPTPGKTAAARALTSMAAASGSGGGGGGGGLAPRGLAHVKLEALRKKIAGGIDPHRFKPIPRAPTAAAAGLSRPLRVLVATSKRATGEGGFSAVQLGGGSAANKAAVSAGDAGSAAPAAGGGLSLLAAYGDGS